MGFASDTWIIFSRSMRLSLRQPLWVLIGLLQPILYLTLFGPLLQNIAATSGFAGDAWVVFVPGLLVQLGIFGGLFVGFGIIAEWRSGVIERQLVTPASRTAIITGRTSRSVELRARSLGIELLYQGVSDKARVYAELLVARKLDASATAYMGDDVVDLPVLRRCGLALTVPEAPLAVKRYADYVTRAAGGRGAAREACELIMHAQGTLERQLMNFQ